MPGAVMSILDCVDLDILLRLQSHLGVVQDINIRHFVVSDPLERSSSIYDCRQ